MKLLLSGGDYLLAEDIAKVEISDDFFCHDLQKTFPDCCIYLCSLRKEAKLRQKSYRLFRKEPRCIHINGINRICSRMVKKKTGDVITETHHPQKIVMIYRKGLALHSSLRRVQRRISETSCWTALSRFLKKHLYISKQRINKKVMGKRTYV